MVFLYIIGIIDIICIVYTISAAQFLVRKIVGLLMDKITKVGEELENEAKEKDYYNDSSLKKELADLKFIKIKRERLGFITIIIGIIEIIAFGFLNFLLIHKYDTYLSYDITFGFLKFFGAWMAIKTLGNYGQWAGSVLGRACFYAFIIGTFLNILFGFLLGLGLAPFLLTIF